MTDEASPLRPLRVRIAAATRAAGTPQYVVEKDYALSYLLWGIMQVPALRDTLVFKGGTCLRKAYFPGYRFSEDLDFTSLIPWNCEALGEALGEAAIQMTTRLLAFGPFVVETGEEPHRGPHPRGQCAFRVRVQFPWMRRPDCTLKVEVAAQEPFLAGAVPRRLIHAFPDEELHTTIPCYRLEEIAAEKLRGFLQARQHLHDRGWLRSRPRDVYDLWHLRQQSEMPVDWRAVGEMLPAKASAYGLVFAGAGDFLDARVWEGIAREWDGQLSTFVAHLPSAASCLAEVRTLIEEVLRG